MASSKNLYKSLNDKLLLNKNEIINLQNELMTHTNINKALNENFKNLEKEKYKISKNIKKLENNEVNYENTIKLLNSEITTTKNLNTMLDECNNNFKKEIN